MIVMLDTGALITLASETRAFHHEMCQCVEFLATKGHRMLVSPLALSEYGVKASISELLAPNLFEVPDFNIRHAQVAARLKALSSHIEDLRDEHNKRAVVYNDLQIMAQAHVEEVNIIITGDKHTFCKTAKKFFDDGEIKCKPVMIDESMLGNIGFTEQMELKLP